MKENEKKQEREIAESKKAEIRKATRRDYFLFNYQNKWDESKIESAADTDYEFTAPELAIGEVGAFEKGDTRHLNNEGIATGSIKSSSKATQSLLDEHNEKLQEEAKKALSKQLEGDTDNLLNEVFSDDEDVPKSSTPKKVELTLEDEEELELLEEELEIFHQDEKKAHEKIEDCKDLIADLDPDDETMDLAQEELEIAQEELQIIKAKIKRQIAQIKQITG